MVLLHLPPGLTSDSSPLAVLAAWEPDPLVVLPLLAIGSLYVIGYRRLGRRAHHAGPGEVVRPRLFLLAYLTLVVALLSPLHGLGEVLFLAHMIQHLLLMSVAAPLLLLANPMPVVLWSLEPGLRARVGHALAPGAGPIRLLRVLTWAPVAWWIFVVNLWLWHQPMAYQAALEQPALHYLQHVLFFGTAVLFWWPVIGPAPLRARLSYPARMLYVFAAWLPNSVLGAGFTFAPAVLMPYYAAQPRIWGLDPLTDQQLAGLIMWLPGDAIYAATMMVLLLAILRQEDRREASSTVLS